MGKNAESKVLSPPLRPIGIKLVQGPEFVPISGGSPPGMFEPPNATKFAFVKVSLPLAGPPLVTDL
ncbi:hypothetical protein CH370_18845 [Leptospira kmetyi]|uniref:Uncharacterized protein n=1 Tax=Leptospira kmetyi TaxID=408139 RepID=A0ABX4NBQ0_9LEPT|nr:hypothetical protein CH378_06440 [Leptospira kmetyi]PJZ39983.1 hypothetical protein CH370_18845 [Leptospira kmetyi]